MGELGEVVTTGDEVLVGRIHGVFVGRGGGVEVTEFALGVSDHAQLHGGEEFTVGVKTLGVVQGGFVLPEVEVAHGGVVVGQVAGGGAAVLVGDVEETELAGGGLGQGEGEAVALELYLGLGHGRGGVLLVGDLYEGLVDEVSAEQEDQTDDDADDQVPVALEEVQTTLAYLNEVDQSIVSFLDGSVRRCAGAAARVGRTAGAAADVVLSCHSEYAFTAFPPGGPG